MLKATLNSSLRLIRTKKLSSDGDELSVVYCITDRLTAVLTENLRGVNCDTVCM